MDRESLAALLKQWALAEGFDRAGVATLEPAATGEAYLRWLARGDQAGMAYLERRVEARLSPALLLPGARSVLCVALQYHPLLDEPEPRGDLWPRVARYARGQDYHDWMGKRLQRLAARIGAEFPGVASRPYVDTGPLLERELAARAGLGAVGKNTNLLHPEAGSWFLLGELLLTLDLAPDAPLADLCGTCSRCLDACPTGALPKPYRLDANRCISYWTIEHRGAMPTWARELTGEWVFGCDICQEVCPWNAAPSLADHPELHLPSVRAELDLAGLLRLSRPEYERRFRASPLKRARLDGLKRNATVALAKRRDCGAEAALTAGLADDSPVVRSHAAWGLGRIGSPAARAALVAAAEAERDPEVQAALSAAVQAIDSA